MTAATLLWVALAGGCGALARWLVDLLLRPAGPLWGTYAANILGSGLLGRLVADDDRGALVVLGIGFCGAFTTFSTAMLQAAERWLDGRRGVAVGHLVGMLLACVAAAMVGAALH